MSPYEKILHVCCANEIKQVYSELKSESKTMMLEALKSTVDISSIKCITKTLNSNSTPRQEKTEFYQEKVKVLCEALEVARRNVSTMDFSFLLEDLQQWGLPKSLSQALSKHYQKIKDSEADSEARANMENLGISRNTIAIGKNIQTFNTVTKSGNSRTDFSNLQQIYIRDLDLFSTAKGKYLEGDLIADPFVLSGVTTFLEDDNGDFIQLALFNMISLGPNQMRVAELKFHKGLRLKISEPFYKIFADGSTGIRVDSPNELHLEEKAVKTIDKIRAEGKELFKSGELVSALKTYFTGIAQYKDTVSVILNNRAQAELKLEENEEALLDSAAVLMFHQNNKKAKLRYQTAAIKLGLVTENVPSIKVLWEKALKKLSAPSNSNFESTKETGNKYYNEGKYMDAKIHYTASLQNDQVCVLLNNIALVSIKLKIFQTAISAAATCLRITSDKKITSKARYCMAKAFSMLGEFHFSKLAAAGEISCRTFWQNVEDAKTQALNLRNKFQCNRSIDQETVVEDLIESASVEIRGDYINSRLVEHRYIEGKGRGVVAMKDIKKGKLILVDHPVSVGGITSINENECEMWRDHDIHAKNRKIRGEQFYQLVSKILQIVNFDRVLAKKLTLLEYRGKVGVTDDKIPLADLKEMGYQNLSYDVLPFISQNQDVSCSNTDKISKSFVEKVVEINAFQGKYSAELKLLRIYALFLRISLFNHSSIPNCTRMAIGDAMAVFSATDIKKGEELTILYLGDDKIGEREKEVWGLQVSKRTRT